MPVIILTYMPVQSITHLLILALNYLRFPCNCAQASLEEQRKAYIANQEVTYVSIRLWCLKL